MEIRQIKHYLKRTGPEEFVIGENVLDPLVLVSGHSIIVDEVYTKYISGSEAWGWGGPSEFGFASSGNLFLTGQSLSASITELNTKIEAIDPTLGDGYVTHPEAIAYAIIFG